MKASYTIEDSLGYIVTSFQGSVTLPELGAHIETIWSDPAWKNHYNGILDFSEATVDLSESEIQGLTMAMQSDARCSFGKWAFVVSTAAAFAKLRQIDHVADVRSSIRIFFDRRTAQQWLVASKEAIEKPKIIP
jgi:hypothetical protein